MMKSFINFLKLIAFVAALVFIVSRFIKKDEIKRSKPIKQVKVIAKSISRTLNKRLGAVLERMQQGKAYSQMELAEQVGISYRSIRRYVDQLVKLNLVKITGRTSATRITKL